MKNALILAMLSLTAALFGCEKAQEKPAQKEVAKPAAPPPPASTKPTSSHGGEVVELGTSKLGSFEVRVSRDEGDTHSGSDASFDLWIDGGVGNGVAAVRIWIGNQDAKGSVKAKAEIEDGKWHSHVEVPSPMPTDSKLWVEVEAADGQKSIGSFDLDT